MISATGRRNSKRNPQKWKPAKLDILMARHRLLSKDVKFADLGLLVVTKSNVSAWRHPRTAEADAEGVDALAMSAHRFHARCILSLVGLRDMSVIETPPRTASLFRPVVASWDEKLIRSSIEQELERGAGLLCP